MSTHLLADVRAAYIDALRHRDRAATDPTPAGRIRAVAHQTAASRLMRILDDHTPTESDTP